MAGKRKVSKGKSTEPEAPTKLLTLIEGEAAVVVGKLGFVGPDWDAGGFGVEKVNKVLWEVARNGDVWIVVREALLED